MHHTTYKRGRQPQCTTVFKTADGKSKVCKHPLSFHGGEDRGACQASGCPCQGFTDGK